MMLRALIYILLISTSLFSQTINRYGSTAANFLEIGVGSANAGMGDAGVTSAEACSRILESRSPSIY